MRARWASRGTGTAALLMLFALVALAVRIAMSYEAVFGHDFVTFTEPDAWYHMRLVDATVRHFPFRIWFDPFLVYPAGEPVNAGPFLDWIIATAALLAGAGRPSDHLIDVVGAFTPPVIGALTALPVYLLGRELFSRRAGLWAAFIVGVLPGQILGRSALGFADHHCLETLLSTSVLAGLVCAMNESRSLRRRFWDSIAAGVLLGCYFLTWGGASLFVLIIVAAAGITMVVNQVWQERDERLLPVVAPAFAVSAAMIVPWLGTRPYFLYDIVALGGGLAVLAALRAWGTATVSFGHGRWIYLAGLAVVPAVCILVAWASRDGWSGLAREIGRISPFRPAGTVWEATPLLRAPGRPGRLLWDEFVACGFLAVYGLVRYVFRSNLTAKGTLLIVWTSVVLAATFGQIRFTYYLAVNVALLAGCAVDDLMDWSDQRLRLRNASVWLIGLAMVLLITVPATYKIKERWVKDTVFSDDWYDALQWLRTNSPEPFGSEDVYDRPELAATDTLTTHGYGVLAWWDYGYWITRIARRVPNTNPKQTQVKEVASFFLAETPPDAARALASLGTRYVIVDAVLQVRVRDVQGEHVGYFASITPWVARQAADYCQDYDLPGTESNTATQTYCFPKYYQTMLVRLFAFGGRAVSPRTVTAISWTDHVRDGRSRKRVVDQRTFGTTQEAERFIASRRNERWRIASADPLISCTPLEALTDFRPVFESLGRLPASGSLGPSAVQIYEFVPRLRSD